MGVRTTQGFNFKLVANDVTLDLFKDEVITISDNITGLFDVGKLPTDFSRQITLPGSKVNNKFFEQYYDISVENPFLFSTSNKVEAYFDFDGLYLASGYLQLNKVNVIANKYIDSYEVTVFGSLASFAREINRAFLTDITTLESLNHTASMANITSSWSGSFLNGDILYPLIDYGKDLKFEAAELGNRPAMDEADGALTTQDFKPAIRVKKVWDAIFEQFGFTYQSDFLTSSIFDNMYMCLHNGGKHFEVDGVDLETLGQIQISPISGSNTDTVMTVSTETRLFWENVEFDPQASIGDNLSYNIGPRKTALDGELFLKYNVSGSAGVPQMYFGIATTASYDADGEDAIYWMEMEQHNRYLRQEYTVTGGNADQDYEVEYFFRTPGQNEDRAFYFFVKYETFGGSNFTVTLAPEGDISSYFKITSQTTGGDFRTIDIAEQMPIGENGIKMIDFIQAIQRKFNLIIYPSKTKPKEFIVETFNNWYKQGEVKDFNKYINLDEKLEVIPANNLAVNKLTFGHSADNDLLSQDFKKETNRPYGESFFIDTQNFFSQGEFKVEPADAASPLRYVEGTGLSGSSALPDLYPLTYQRTSSTIPYEVCNNINRIGFTDNPAGELDTGFYVYINNLGTPLLGYRYVGDDISGDIYEINPATGQIIGFETNCTDVPTS